MSRKRPLAPFTVRLPDEEYFRLENEAERNGMNMAQYARHVIINRGAHTDKAAGQSFEVPRDLARHLATAMAITIITGAVTTEGLEDLLERTTLEIMQSLGAA